MARKKRTPEQMERDRSRVSDLMLMGYSTKEIQDTILAETGYALSPAQVGLAKKHVRDAWFDKQIVNYTAILAQELDRLDVMEQELWRQLRLSAEPKIRKTIDRYQGAFQSEREAAVAKISETTESARYDRGYFNLIITVQQERRKLLGAYAPEHKTISHDVAIKGYTTVSPSDWDDDRAIEGEYETG